MYPILLILSLTFLMSCKRQTEYKFVKNNDKIILEIDNKSIDTFVLRDYLHYRFDTIGAWKYSTNSSDADCKIYQKILEDKAYLDRIKTSLDIELVNKFYADFYDKSYEEIINDTFEMKKVKDLLTFSQFYFNDERINNYIEIYNPSYIFNFFISKKCPEDKYVGTFWEKAVGYCKEIEMSNIIESSNFIANGSWAMFYQKHPRNFGDDVGFLFTPINKEEKLYIKKQLLNPTSYNGKSFIRHANDYPQSPRNKDTTYSDVRKIDTLIWVK